MPPPKGGLVSIKEEVFNDEISPAPAQSKPVKTTPEKKPEARASEKALGPDSENLSPQAIEREYMLKAAEYVTSLPPDVGPTAELVKNVTAKLRRPYAPSAILEPDIVKILKARYVDAVVTFVGELHKGGKSISKDQVREILASSKGNFLTQQALYLACTCLDACTCQHKR
jgi:hypothetical protein